MAEGNTYHWPERITASLFPYIVKERNNGFWRLTIQQPNQANYIETFMNNWKIDGLAIVYNQEKVKIAELTFRDGIVSGPCKLYYSEDKLYFQGILEDGYRQWKGTEYDERGDVTKEGFYDRGKLRDIYRSKEMPGYWREYENGRLISITQRDDYSRKEGLCYFYDEEGKISRISKWKHDEEKSSEGYCKIFDEPRNMWYDGRFENGVFQGRGVVSDSTGEVRFDGFFNQGERIDTIVPSDEMPGYWKEYDEHGRLVSITQRDDFGRIEGICYFYDESGEIFQICELTGGKKLHMGKCKIFDEPRRIWYEGHFENGYRQYRGTEYKESGEVEFDGFYDKGKRKESIVPFDKMPGYWKEYDEHGRLVSITQRDDFERNEGICYFYDEKGGISRISEWKDGKEVSDTGYCEIYDVNRDYWYKGHFEKGKKLTKTPYKGKKGYWQECNEDNQLVTICSQDKDEKNDGICYFYSNGRINRVSFWEHGDRSVMKEDI